MNFFCYFLLKIVKFNIKWSKVFIMPNKNKFAPNSILDVKQYIFCDFEEELVLLNPNFVKLYNSSREAFKSFDLNFKKDIPYLR